MLFKKKGHANQEELALKVFQTKVELRRILEKYETMLERELRMARTQKASGVQRPANYERIRTIAGLVTTTRTAYEELDAISTTDELNRTTDELNAALRDLNRITGASQRADVGGLRRGLKQMNAGEAQIVREYQVQDRVMSRAGMEPELDAILADALAPSQSQQPHQPQRAMTDEELKAQMDEIDRHLYSVLEDI